MTTVSRVVKQPGGFQILWTADDVERARIVIEEILKDELLGYLKSKVFVRVSGYGNVAAYQRALPGKAGVAKVLGKEFFESVGAVMNVGLQAYEDSQRSDLTGSQRLGRVSIALLGSAVPPIGLLLLGAQILAPEKTDQITKLIFSSGDPLVSGLADAIVYVGGARFQAWSAKPNWIDFF